MDPLKNELTQARKRQKVQAQAVGTTETVLAHARANNFTTLIASSEDKLRRQVKTLQETENLIKELETSTGALPLDKPTTKKGST